jgi:glutaredoxin
MTDSSNTTPPAARELTIFHTPGCGRCQAAAQFFRERGFVLSMADVANDFSALRRMARLCPGTRTVPVIQWAQEVFVGFDAGYWQTRLERDS